MQVSAPRYPNQQLRAVSLETYFVGRLSVLTKLDVVQENLRTRLPKLFVPNARPDEALALRPFMLGAEDDSEAVAVAVNQASYVSRSYPGHEAFLARGCPMLADALRVVGVDRLERVLYRYENEVALGRDTNGALPLQNVFQFAMPDGLPVSGVTNLHVDFTRVWERGRTGLEIRLEERAPGTILRFFVVAAVAPGGDVGELAGTAQVAHDEAVRLFEQIISDSFRTLISGGEGGGSEG